MNDIKIRDLRTKEKFQIDDKYLNGYAKVCGWQATLVYNSLCRHADKDQYSFPSIDLMAKQHNISRPTIVKGINSLKKYNIIQVLQERKKDGSFKNNRYILLDKSDWKPIQVNDVDMDTQVNVVDMGQPQTQVNVVDNKDTHILRIHRREQKFNSLKYLLTPSLEDLNEFKEKFGLTEEVIREEAEKAHDWLQSKGFTHRYKNYKAFLRNWLRRVSQDLKPKPKQFMHELLGTKVIKSTNPRPIFRLNQQPKST